METVGESGRSLTGFALIGARSGAALLCAESVSGFSLCAAANPETVPDALSTLAFSVSTTEHNTQF